ncbi:deaminase [Marinicrinis sediminis]|uniref:Deaminase n=1 Tax=Marinicrinis sediminis TaxID=1652465 RepID=A0ABW5RA29_9BACL
MGQFSGRRIFEIDVIRQAGQLLMDKKYKNKCTLYSTVEPCPMCAGALILADIARSVWALSDDYLGAVRIMKAGNHFRHKFDKICVTAMPYKDLAIWSQKLHRLWGERRGVKYRVSDVSENTWAD